MVIEGSSDIVVRCEFIEQGDHANTQWLTFRNGNVLVLAAGFMALYKDTAAISDPLGNGLKAMTDLPEQSLLQFSSQGFVKEYTAGFIRLWDDKAILITPNDIQLFNNNMDALHNKNEITRLALA